MDDTVLAAPAPTEPPPQADPGEAGRWLKESSASTTAEPPPAPPKEEATSLHEMRCLLYEAGWDAVGKPEDALRRILGRLREAAREVDADYNRACQTVALMHAAAVGEVRGPTRGVVEDVEDLRARLARVTKALRPLKEKPCRNWDGATCNERKGQWQCDPCVVRAALADPVEGEKGGEG